MQFSRNKIGGNGVGISQTKLEAHRLVLTSCKYFQICSLCVVASKRTAKKCDKIKIDVQ